MELSSCLGSRILRRLRGWRCGFPHSVARPGAPPGLVASCPAPFTFRLCLGLEFSGLPEFPLPWLRLMGHRVSSDAAPSGFAVPASSGFPESCIYGWVDDDFPVFLELCILGGAADESSNPIGPCTFQSDIGCILNLIRASRMPASRQAQRQFQPHPASYCRGGTAFPDSLPGHQLNARVGLINLWKQVQKVD